MPKVSKGYSLDHAYGFYKKKHFDKGDAYEVDKATYRKICYAFNKKVIDKALTGSLVKLPHSMGCIWCKKFKINWEKPPIDLNETRKKGKVVYHLNEHSNGWCARWTWSKRNNLIANLIYYSFKPTRSNSRKLSNVMQQPEGHKTFFS